MALPLVDNDPIDARIQKLVAFMEYLAADATAANEPCAPLLASTSALLRTALPDKRKPS